MPVGRTLARALAGAAGAALGLRLAGAVTRPVGPVDVRARLGVDPAGGTVLDIPPLGTVRLRTHAGPLCVRAMAVDVSPHRARKLGTNLTRLRRRGAADLAELGKAVGVRSAVAGVTGAAATAAVTLHGRRDVLGAAVTGAALLGIGGAVAAASLDRKAWRDPQLSGLLTKAPLVLGDLRTAPDRIGTYRDQLVELLATGTEVYRRVAALPEPPPADAIRLLHVSDVHLSPAAYPLAKALVDDYGVEVVVDTGDLVDWGSPPEELFAKQVAALGVPYVFVKGNHDSAGIARAVSGQPNATVLDARDEPVTIAGLTFAGMADPRFTPDKTTGDDSADHRVSEVARDFAAGLAGKNVDIALAHDPAAGHALAGVVPLVLAGHTHKRSVRRFGDTVVLVQGTSGGSGLRGVQVDPPAPVSLSVLYFDRTTRRLAVVDEITLGGIGTVALNVVRRRAAELT